MSRQHSSTEPAAATAAHAEQLALHGGAPAVDRTLPGGLQGVLEIGDAEIEAVTAVLKRRKIFRFLNEESVSESARLEAAYRDFCGVPYALALGGGGTGALITGLVGLGVGSGDEVLVPGYTYIATAAACLSVGAIPILVEVDESLTMDPEDAERKITEHTVAMIPVHMRGFPADMDRLTDVARRHDLKVLEDVAQANGGTYKGRLLGSIGHAGAFSFQHYKAITAGEGGMLVTHDEQVYRRAAVKHDSAMQFWKSDEGWEPFAGENYRMCELRAALGLSQFDRLPGILSACRATKRRLLEGVADLDRIRPAAQRDPDGDCGIVFAFFLPEADEAKRFSEALAAEGVPAGTIYNKQIPDRHIYSAWDYVMEKRSSDPHGWPWTAARRPISYSRDMLPNTLELLGRSIAISLNQQWTQADADAVIRAIRKVHAGLYG